MIDAKLLEKLVDAANDGVVVAEKEGEDNILIYVNKAFELLTGYTADEILYQDCRFLQNGDRDQPGLHRIKEALKKGLACREVIRNYRKDGSLFWNELSITPVYNEEDKLTYFIGVQKDVTARVENEKKLADLQAELEALKSSIKPQASE